MEISDELANGQGLCLGPSKCFLFFHQFCFRVCLGSSLVGRSLGILSTLGLCIRHDFCIVVRRFLLCELCVFHGHLSVMDDRIHECHHTTTFGSPLTRVVVCVSVAGRRVCRVLQRP